MWHYRKLVRECKQCFGPFTVRRVRMPNGDAGDCRKTPAGFQIRIDKNLEELAAMDALIHEVAHMLSYDEFLSGIEHGPKWARKYRLCYLLHQAVCKYGDS